MITLTSSKLVSVAQDGTQLNLVEQTGSDPLDGGINAVTEKKLIYAEFEVEENVDNPELQLILPGGRLFVSWALFFPRYGVYQPQVPRPSCGFSINIPDTSYDGDRLEMAFFASELQFPKSLKNLKCYFTLLTESTFRIELEYYNTFDEDGYMNNEAKSNQWRFLSEHWTVQNTNEVEGSVYDVSKDLRLYVHVEQDAVDLPEEFAGPVIESQEFILWQGSLSRFSSQSEFMDENGEALAKISSENDTEIIARIYTEENTLDKFYAKLIRIRDDQSLDFIENYDLQENEIIEGGAIDNVFKGPFTVSRNDYEGYYELSFNIDKDYITEGAVYRIILVGYETGGSAFARTGISNTLPVANVAPYCSTSCGDEAPSELEFTATLLDIDKEFTGNFLTCAIEERMRTKLIVDYSDNKWRDNLDCRRGLNAEESVTSNDIRNYLTNIGMQIYTEYADASLGGTVKNVLDEKNIQKIGPNTYSSNGPSFTFDTVNEIITLYYDFRNRNQSTIPALYTLLNGSGYLPIQDDQYWGGKTIFIRWTLTFYYYNWPVPFIDNLHIIQKMVVKDYSNDVVMSRITPGSFLCPGQQVCYKGTIAFGTPANYNNVNTLELSDGNGGGSGNPEEEESWIPSELPISASTKIIGQDITYAGTDAQFCTVVNTLLTNQTYKFASMAKKQL